MMVFMLETKSNRTTAVGIYQQIAFIWKKKKTPSKGHHAMDHDMKKKSYDLLIMDKSEALLLLCETRNGTFVFISKNYS